MLGKESLHGHTYDVSSEKRLQSELWRGKWCLHTASWRKQEAMFAFFPHFFANLAILSFEFVNFCEYCRDIIF